MAWSRQKIVGVNFRAGIQGGYSSNVAWEHAFDANVLCRSCRNEVRRYRSELSQSSGYCFLSDALDSSLTIQICHFGQEFRLNIIQAN